MPLEQVRSGAGAASTMTIEIAVVQWGESCSGLKTPLQRGRWIQVGQQDVGEAGAFAVKHRWL